MVNLAAKQLDQVLICPLNQLIFEPKAMPPALLLEGEVRSVLLYFQAPIPAATSVADGFEPTAATVKLGTDGFNGFEGHSF